MLNNSGVDVIGTLKQFGFGFTRISVPIISETIRKKMMMYVNTGSQKLVGVLMMLSKQQNRKELC